MDIILNFFKYIIGLGPSVMMPLIIIILCLIFKAKLTLSIKAGLTAGIGFIGLNVIIGLMLDAIQPITKALVDLYGFTLTVTDTGWTVGASIAWGTEMVPFVFVAIVATNAVLILCKLTKTLNVDIWNFWHAMIVSSALYLTTESILLAVLGSILITIIQLVLADYTQKDVAEVLGLEGISMTHTQANCWAVVGYPVNWIISRIPVLKDINWTPEGIQKKLGLFAEPMLLGFIIGFLLSASARMPLDTILKTSMIISASLVLMPRMVALLMDGLSVLADAAQEFMSDKFPGRELYIGVDAALGIGHPFVITLGLLMIPIALILAFILPGNVVLPLADLTVLSFFMIFAIVPTKGNLFRGFIAGVIIMALTLYLAGAISPLMTSLAPKIGVDTKEGMITSLNVATGWYDWFVYYILQMFH